MTADFLDMIFHDVPDDECVLIAKQAENGFIHTTHETRKFQRWLDEGSPIYFNISTVARQDPLRRRSEDCRAAYCVVLDDIGTKVEEPPVEPSWKLETSEGSFQWGYLIDPTEDLEGFNALMDALADAGYTDAGAKGFNRLMRLPGSVNTKPGRNGFVSKLHEVDADRVFTVAEISNNFNVTAKTGKPRPKSAVPMVKDVEVDDEVVEYLTGQSMVIDDDGEWLTITCPNADAHTTGDDTARYCPLGRGTDKYQHIRGFKCFHEHCQDFDFFEWLEDNGGPRVRRHDPLPFLQIRYVYVAQGRRVCDLQALEEGGRYDYAIEEFGDLMADLRVAMPTPAQPKRTLSGKAAFLEDPDTVKCSRYVSIPYRSDEDRGGVEHGEGSERVVNVYRPPVHVAAPSHLDVFVEHMSYLLPVDDELECFLDWLAYKYQNPRRRAFGVVMVAEDAFGIGRSWLSDVLRDVWQGHVASIDIGELTGHGASAGFNDWGVGAQIVVVEEAHDGSDTTHFRAYERIKTLIDPRVVETIINSKFGSKRKEFLWFNLLVMSNHADAFFLPKDERRLAVFANPTRQREAEYYTRLWATYRNHGANLAAAVAEFLLARDVSGFDAARPPMTEAKRTMLETSRSPGEVVAIAVCERAKGELVTKLMLHDLFDEAERSERLDNSMTNNMRRRTIDKLWRQLGRLTEHRNGVRVRVGDARVEVRALRRRGYWYEYFIKNDNSVVLAELAKTAQGIGETTWTKDGVERLY